MSVTANLEQGKTNVNVNLAYEAKIQKIREELILRYAEYHKTMAYLAADAPIEILCLPKTLETILIKNGFNRVYDVVNLDFTKIKGFGVVRAGQLASCVNQFLAML